MVIKERTTNVITNICRTELRSIPLELIKNGYDNLIQGSSEWYVCTTIGVNPNVFEGVLKSALEEALWERGHYSMYSRYTERRA